MCLVAVSDTSEEFLSAFRPPFPLPPKWRQGGTICISLFRKGPLFKENEWYQSSWRAYG